MHISVLTSSFTYENILLFEKIFVQIIKIFTIRNTVCTYLSNGTHHHTTYSSREWRLPLGINDWLRRADVHHILIDSHLDLSNPTKFLLCVHNAGLVGAC